MTFTAGKIGVKAMALIWRQGTELLLEQIQNPDGAVIRYRPLGGSVEFGEKSWETLTREFMEELGEDIKIVRLIEVVENIFTWADRPGHEITFVYEATLLNAATYDENTIERVDVSNDTLQVKTAHWLDPFRLPNGLPLFPAGLADVLKAQR